MKLSLTFTVRQKLALYLYSRQASSTFSRNRCQVTGLLENGDHIVPSDFAFQVVIGVTVMSGYGNLVVK